MRLSLRTAILLVLLLASRNVWAADTVLENGVPLNTFLNALTYANAYIEVPAGATMLTVTVTNGSGDLDLYMKFGARISGGTVGELEANADVKSEGPTASETIVLTTTSTPPIRAGTWYIATLNLNSTTTNFTLTATYEVPATKVIPGPGNAAILSVTTNDNFLVPWGSVSLAYNIKSFSRGTKADLYLAIVLADGSAFLIDKNYGLTSAIVPFAPDIPLVDGETQFLAGQLPGTLSHTSLSFYALLVKEGADIFSPSNWLSKLASTTVSLGNLSGIQGRILSERGYPQAVDIYFDRQSQLRIESWFYQGDKHHFTKRFRFLNGSLSNGDSLDSAQGGERVFGEALPSITCGPGVFSPGTTVEDLRRSLGDPVAVLSGDTPAIKIWVYPRLRIRVTVNNGTIERIEAE